MKMTRHHHLELTLGVAPLPQQDLQVLAVSGSVDHHRLACCYALQPSWRASCPLPPGGQQGPDLQEVGLEVEAAFAHALVQTSRLVVAAVVAAASSAQ